MTKIIVAAATVCALVAGPAFGQTSKSETTTTQELDNSTLTGPDQAVSKEVKSKTYNSDGSETKIEEEITRSGGGVTAESRSKTISPDGSETTKERERTVNPDGSSSSSTTTETTR